MSDCGAGCAEYALDIRGTGGSPGAVGVVASYGWTWPNAQTRQAQSVTVADVGKIGFQTDMALEYKLVGVSPSRWAALPDPAYGVLRKHLNERGLTGPINVGINMPNAVGTSVAKTPTATTRSTILDRVTLQSSAVANSQGQRYHAGGSGGVRAARNANIGWRLTWTFVIGTTSPTSRLMVGLSDNGSFGAASTINNGLLVGRMGGIGETNLQLMRSGPFGTGGLLSADLGSDFPFSTDAGYRFETYTADCTTWAWQVTAINTGVQVSGSVSDARVPAATGEPVLFPVFMVHNGTDAIAVQVDCVDCILQPRIFT